MRFRLEYLIVKAVELCVRPLPLSLVRTLGEGLGLSFYLVDRVHRRIALANLEVAFPNRTQDERKAIAQSMFRHFGRLLLELLKYASMPRHDQLGLVEWEGEERVRLALAQGKGILFCTGHFGFWEQQALAHALKFAPMAVMARPLDNPKLHDLLEHIRTSNGNPVLYRRGAVRKALRLLAEGKGVGILIDQHMTSADAIYVDFFGRPAATTSTLAALALRTGAPVIPLFAFPLPNGRYRMIYEHPVEPPRRDSTDAVREFTQRCTDVLEMHVRRHPELWLWMHRRWRDAPGPALDAAPGMFPSAKADLGLKTSRDKTGLGIGRLIHAPNWLGDAVMALPAIRDMRRHFSGSSLTIAARPPVAPLFRAVPGVDRLEILDSRRASARLTADIGILLPNSFRSAWLLKRAGVKERWGYRSDFRRVLLTRAVRRPRTEGAFRRVPIPIWFGNLASKPDR